MQPFALANIHQGFLQVFQIVFGKVVLISSLAVDWPFGVGKGKTIVDGMEQNVKAGDVITMSAGCRHTVIAETELKLIEVQLGEAIDVHDKQKFELEY